jgi:O-antigen/teichoic acid export membrane protein
VRKFRLFDVKGDLFALGATWIGNALLRIGSSLILTRVLTPSAYGTMGVLVSIVLILVMLSDTGFAVCIVRSEHGDEPRYLNTAWTMHILRAVVNAALMYFGAPLLARLYHSPVLTAPLKLLALWFLIDGLESPAFPVALRRKRSRVTIYAEFTGAVISTVFTIIYCYFHRNFWGMVYGYLFYRLIVVALSHSIKLDFPLRPIIDWAAAKEMFEYTRFVMPSSTLTLFLNQFDKAVFLRLFDLNTLGIYSLAGGIAGQVDTVINRAATAVLYPRCAHNFRTERKTFALKYYLENLKLYVATLGIPAALGGGAHFVISLLYDPRYIRAAEVLQAFMMRSLLTALASPAENMLVATGESRIILTGNLYRAISIVAGSLLGYRLFGFMGFTYGVALAGLPTLVYYLWLQKKKEYLMPRYELYKIVFVCAVATAAYLTSTMLASLWHPSQLRTHA